MCDIMTAISIGSTVLGGIQSYQQGKYQEGVANYNARQQENEATRTRNAGVEAQNDRRLQTRFLQAQQRAVAAARGADVSSGSPLKAQEDAETIGRVDEFRINRNFQERADALKEGAALTRAEGKAAKAAGRNALLGSLITAGGTVASKWYKGTGGSGKPLSGSYSSRGGSLAYAPSGDMRGFSGGRFGGGV